MGPEKTANAPTRERRVLDQEVLQVSAAGDVVRGVVRKPLRRNDVPEPLATEPGRSRCHVPGPAGGRLAVGGGQRGVECGVLHLEHAGGMVCKMRLRVGSLCVWGVEGRGGGESLPCL